MENKWILYLIIGITTCVLGIPLFIFGYGIYKGQAFIFDYLTLILFVKYAPNLPIDPFYFSYYVEIYLNIYIMLLTFIQEILQPIFTFLIFPVSGIICLSFSGIFIVLTIISIQQQYFGRQKISKVQKFDPKQ